MVHVTKYYYAQIKDDEIFGSCGMYREQKNVYRVLVVKPDRKRPLGRPRRTFGIIFKWIIIIIFIKTN